VKKINLILSILALLLTACSATSLFPAAPTATIFLPAALSTETPVVQAALPSVTASATPTSLSTNTPVVAFATFTVAPTYTSTGTPPTATLAPTATANGTGTSTPLVQPTPEGPVFQSVTVSGTQYFWGDTCLSNSITFTAQVANGFNVASVYLFTRLQSSNGNVTSAWNKPVTMHDDGLGTFTYDVTLDVIKYYQDYNTAWVQYQFVATDSHEVTVGRTQVYINNIMVSRGCP